MDYRIKFDSVLIMMEDHPDLWYCSIKLKHKNSIDSLVTNWKRHWLVIARLVWKCLTIVEDDPTLDIIVKSNVEKSISDERKKK